MKRLTSSSFALLAITLGTVDCGGRSELRYDLGAGESGGGQTTVSADGGAAPRSTGGATAAGAGGTPPSAGGFVGSIGGAVPRPNGGAPSTGGTPSTGGAADGVGGSPDLDLVGSFYFLGSTWRLPEGISFASWPSTLSRYIPEQDPWHFFSYSSAVTIPFAQPPNETSSTFLLGVSSWADGENQYLQSYEAYDDKGFVNHGLWGTNPLGEVESRVDAALKLNDEVLVVMNWNAALDQGEIWFVNDGDALTQDQPQDGLKLNSGKLILEAPGIRLAYHGLTSTNEALFSDGNNLIFLNELGSMTVIEGLEQQLSVITRSPYSDGLLATFNVDGRQGVRIHDETWSELHLDDNLLPESVTWVSANSVVYESAGDIFLWSPSAADAATTTPPVIVSDFLEGYQPRGGSVIGDFGTAMRVQSGGIWAVAFLDDDSLSFCEHSTTKVGALEPHIRDGIAGVLFDEVSPEDDRHFGSIYFCAPGQAAVDLLEEFDLHGILLSR